MFLNLCRAATKFLNGRPINSLDLPTVFHATRLTKTDMFAVVIQFAIQFSSQPRLKLCLQARPLPHDLVEFSGVVLSILFCPVDHKSVDV